MGGEEKQEKKMVFADEFLQKKKKRIRKMDDALSAYEAFFL